MKLFQLFAAASGFSKYVEEIKKEFEVLEFNPSRILDMLPHMGVGMLVIFVIIGIIILTTLMIQTLFSKKKH